MKRTLVSFVLLLLGACEWPEPTAPGPKLPMMTAGDSVVIFGRVVSASQSQELQGVHVRVVEANANVLSDESGNYRIALPVRFRGQPVSVLIRMIGYKPLQVSRAIASHARIDAMLESSAMILTCVMPVVRTGVGVQDR